MFTAGRSYHTHLHTYSISLLRIVVVCGCSCISKRCDDGRGVIPRCAFMYRLYQRARLYTFERGAEFEGRLREFIESAYQSSSTRSSRQKKPVMI